MNYQILLKILAGLIPITELDSNGTPLGMHSFALKQGLELYVKAHPQDIPQLDGLIQQSMV